MTTSGDDLVLLSFCVVVRNDAFKSTICLMKKQSFRRTRRDVQSRKEILCGFQDMYSTMKRTVYDLVRAA